jgi:flagellar biosynthesis protein FlhG
MNEPIIVSVGGGKGGIGKSTITAHIGAVLSQKGFRVGFVDADLGGANLHSFVGVQRPAKGLQDFLSGRSQSLESIACETAVDNSWLISGASDILDLANPKFGQKQRIIAHLKKMKADFILIDLGAGTSNHVTDFYTSFPHGIIVSDGLPMSIENAYGFLKNGIIRGLMRLFPDRKDIGQLILRFSDPGAHNGFSTVGEMLSAAHAVYPVEAAAMKQWLFARKNFLVLNMVKEEEDIRVGRRFVELVRKYLSISLFYIGYVAYSPQFRPSARALKPLMLLLDPDAAAGLSTVAANLIALTRG